MFHAREVGSPPSTGPGAGEGDGGDDRPGGEATRAREPESSSGLPSTGQGSPAVEGLRTRKRSETYVARRSSAVFLVGLRSLPPSRVGGTLDAQGHLGHGRGCGRDVGGLPPLRRLCAGLRGGVGCLRRPADRADLGARRGEAHRAHGPERAPGSADPEDRRPVGPGGHHLGLRLARRRPAAAPRCRVDRSRSPGRPSSSSPSGPP